MEVIAEEIAPWGFLYDLFLKMAFFVLMPYLLVLSQYKKKFFKLLLIIISVYALFAAIVIAIDYDNEFALAKDYGNNKIEIQEMYIKKIDNEGPRPDYFIVKGDKYMFLMSKSDEFWDDNFEGHLCEVEYYATSRRVKRIKVID